MQTVKDTLGFFSELGGRSYESARQLGELNLRTWEKLVDRQMDAMNLWMETGVAQIKTVSDTTDYQDLLGNQVELAKGLGERMLEQGRVNMKLAGEIRDEYRAWLEEGVSVLSDQIN